MRKCRTGTSGIRSKKTPPPREKRGVGVLIHGFQSIHNARHL